MPVNDGQERVTAFQIDFQMFAEGEGGGEAGGGAAAPESAVETSPLDALYDYKPIDGFSDEIEGESDGDIKADPGTADQGEEEIPEEVKKEQSHEANEAFKKMRQDNEKLQAELKRRDDEIAKRFGEKGIKTFDDVVSGWDKAIEQQAQQQQQQTNNQIQNFNAAMGKMVEDMKAEGYGDAEIRRAVNSEVALFKANMIELQIKQSEERRQLEAQQVQQQAQVQQAERAVQQRVATEFDELKGEYPGFAKVEDLAQSVGPETWQKICQKFGLGYSLLDAYESVNRQALKEKATAAVKQQTLNQVNGRAHLKPSGGRSEVDTVTIPEETLKMYKQLNPGKTHKEYLEHYKKSLKG